jgi:hypothetical protein
MPSELQDQPVRSGSRVLPKLAVARAARSALGSPTPPRPTVGWPHPSRVRCCCLMHPPKRSSAGMDEEPTSGIERAVFGGVGRDNIDAWLRRHLQARLGGDLAHILFAPDASPRSTARRSATTARSLSRCIDAWLTWPTCVLPLPANGGSPRPAIRARSRWTVPPPPRHLPRPALVARPRPPTVLDRARPSPGLVHVWSTCHRSRAVRNGLQRYVTGAGRRCDPGEQARAENPDKDEVPKFTSWQATHHSRRSRPPGPIIAPDAQSLRRGVLYPGWAALGSVRPFAAPGSPPWGQSPLLGAPVPRPG